MELKPIIEAMIFVSDEPIAEGAILAALADAGIEKSAVRDALSAIEREWNGDAGRGVGVVQVAGGYQFRTKSPFADWLRRLNVPKPIRLSGPALETLAIVAYRQPIVKSEIERIRGVDTGGVLKTLLERRLLRIVGRQDEPGQPLLYGTTRDFLEIFNLNALTELPSLKDIEDLMRERRTLTEVRPEGSPAAGDDARDEESTETIDVGDGEEGTQAPQRRRIDDDVEDEKVDGRDIEALAGLEESLRGLKRIERGIFPKLPKEGESQGGEDGEGTLSTTGEHGEGPQALPEPGSAGGIKAD